MEWATRFQPARGGVTVTSVLFFVSTFLLRGTFEGSQVVIEAAEGVLPVAAVALDPFGYFLKRGGIEPAWTPLSLAAARNEAGALQNLEVFGD